MLRIMPKLNSRKFWMEPLS